MDWYLTRRYRTTDYFFALSQCLEVRRLEMVLALAKSSNVEIMCHPAVNPEGSLLLSDEFGRRLAGITLGSYQQIC